MLRPALLALLLLPAGPLAAELTQSEEQAFTVDHSLSTVAAPYVVWRTLTAHIDQWWNPAHSWTGEAARLYMETERGGCFCERLPDGGFVEHLRIVYLAPGREIRFEGGLGPLQTMPVQGRMTWTIEPAESGSTIRFTYQVFGHPEGGLAGIAPAVDGVIGEQPQRLGERLARD
jgi:uncharacterized protein YndB with AHSA1/START domain